MALCQTSTYLPSWSRIENSEFDDSNLANFYKLTCRRSTRPVALEMLEGLALLNAGLEDLPLFSSDVFPIHASALSGSSPPRVHMPNPDSAERREDLCVPEYSATRISVSLALSSRPARVLTIKF